MDFMHSVVSSSNFYPGNTAIGDYIGRALEGMRNNTPVYERVVSDLWRAKISGPIFTKMEVDQVITQIHLQRI